MNYLPAIILLILGCSVSYAQKVDVGPGDMRYNTTLPPLPGSSSYYTQLGEESHPLPVLGGIAQKPGYVFLASAVLPGLGQAANQQWWKTGLFMALEATAVGIYVHKENVGRSGERRYERFANKNWSVVAYAQWMVETYNLDTEGLLKPGYENTPLSEISPNWGATHEDWDVIHIEALRDLERQSLYTTGHAFNHHMPDYDSQQYYELVSKYFQYAPGWNDFEDPFNGRLDVELGYFSPNAWEHAGIGYRFNDDLNIAGHMLTVLFANHFVAAFDAYFTHVLRNNRVQASASMRNGPAIRLTYNF